MARSGRLAVALLLAALFASVALPTAAQQPADYPITNGYFYTQANGKAGEGGTGFSVTNNDDIPFFAEFRRLGGVAVVGYPISRRFLWDGFVSQAFQKVVFQWRPEQDAVLFVNVLDKLSDTGQDNWLRTVRSVPNPIKLDENGKSFDQIKAGRLALLDTNPAIKKFYLDVPGDPVIMNGLPTSAVEDFGNSFVLRAQRVVFQHWKIDVPWAKAGTVQVANGGDIGKEANLYPDAAVQPEPAGGQSGTPVPARPAGSPAPSQPAPSQPAPVATAAPAVANPQATPVPAGAAPYAREIDKPAKFQPAFLKETPNAQWILVKLHQLTACENPGNGVGILRALDAAGNPIDGVSIRADSSGTVVDYKTGAKGPGWVEAYFFRGNWTAWVLDGPSDIAANMNTVLFPNPDIPEERNILYCGNQLRNSASHFSYEAVWRKRG